MTRKCTASPSAWFVPVSATLLMRSVLSGGSNGGYAMGAQAAAGSVASASGEVREGLVVLYTRCQLISCAFRRKARK
jgi:hypothetical protein